MNDFNNSSVGVIIMVGFLILSIISLVGLVYLTRFSFGAKPNPDDKKQRCVKMTNGQQNFTKVTVILLWLNIGLSILFALFSLFSQKQTSISYSNRFMLHH